MIKNFTSKKVFTLIIGLFVFTVINAQQTITKKIAAEGGDYTSVFAALQALGVSADPKLAAGDIVILNIEGTVNEATSPAKFYQTTGGTTNIVIKVPIKLTIQGAGPDKSILQGAFLPDGTGTEGRLWQVNAYDDTAIGTFGGSEITFKDITMRWFGGKANNSGANGAIISFSITKDKTCAPVKWYFKNINFTECSGRSIFNIGGQHHEIEFDNCIFQNNNFYQSTELTAMNGVINKWVGGVLTVKNSTFFKNTFKPAVTAGNNGVLVNLAPPVSVPSTFTFENNQASNNLYDATALTNSPMGMVGIGTPSPAGTLTYNISKNVMIGNRRSGTNMDVDFSFASLSTTPITASDNIVNEAIERVSDGAATPTYTYPRITASGYDISPDYTYTSPKVNYEMDGALPKLVNDAFGIGHFKTKTTSADIMGEGQLRAYQGRNNEIQIDGQVSKAAVATLYDLQGRVIKVQQLQEGSQNVIDANLKPSVYLLKVKDNNRQQTIKLLTGK